MKKETLIFLVLFVCGYGSLCECSPGDPANDLTGIPVKLWTTIFDGKTLNGWKVLKEGEFETGGPIQVKDGNIEFGTGMPYSAVSWTGKFPTENYEVEMRAMRLTDMDIFCGILFPVGTNHVSMVLGGWGNSIVGLSCIDDLNASENNTTQIMSFKNNQWYHVRVRVTKEKIEGWIDNKQIINQERKGHRISPYPGLELLAPFGIFTWETGAALRDLRIRRLDLNQKGGKGFGIRSSSRGEEKLSIRAKWEMPPRCTPFAEPRIEDLKEELKRTGYRLVIAIHPKEPDESKGESVSRDLYIINADGTGLKQITNTPDKDEHIPRTSPDGKCFTFNWGDCLVDVKTLNTKKIWGGYVWTPDSKKTVYCSKKGLIYVDMKTGEESKPIPLKVKVKKPKVDIVDMSCDGRWFIFEIRNYLGCKYTIDFMPSQGGEIRKMPNHPKGEGECHPAFSPDGKWMCWNAGGSLSIRRFDPSLPEGTDGKIITLPKELIGQDPCGRWSHCGRYIAYVKISHEGTWKVHSPLHIVRIADSKTIRISPPGWLGHHWDYDWLPPADE